MVTLMIIILVSLIMAVVIFIVSLFLDRKLSINFVVPTIISLFSVYYVSRNHKRDKYNDATSFHIVQNLWDPNDPRFSLTNESTKKLKTIPGHYYVMLIPSKVHFRIIKDDKTFGFYFLVLSPFSYQTIIKQTDFLQTTGAIEISYLPSNFYTKKGVRDNIYGKVLKPSDDRDMALQVETLPMILVATKLSYEYLNNDSVHISRFITTPVSKIPLSEYELINIFQYVHDNADLEIKPNGNESIYETANKNITERCYKNITNDKMNSASFLGIKQGRHYGRVLKALSNVITPVDSMEKFENEKYRG